MAKTMMIREFTEVPSVARDVPKMTKSLKLDDDDVVESLKGLMSC